MQSNPTQTMVTRAVKPANNGGNSMPPANMAPLETREAGRNRQSFERSLERLAQTDGRADAGSGAASARSIDDRPERDTGGGSDQRGDRDEDSGDPKGTEVQGAARTPAPINAANFTPPVVVAAPMLSPDQLAALQRMAAAIAEVAKGGIDARMTVEFGASNHLASGAILGRDARGAMTIHIVNATAHLPPAVVQMLRADLMQRLLRRKLNVAGVDFLDASTLTEAAVRRDDKQG